MDDSFPKSMEVEEGSVRLHRTKSWLANHVQPQTVTTDDVMMTSATSNVGLKTSASDSSLVQSTADNLSPVSNLALHLSHQSLNSTPRRRLSLDDSGSSTTSSVSPSFEPPPSATFHVLEVVPEDEAELNEVAAQDAAVNFDLATADDRSQTPLNDDEINGSFIMSNVVASMRQRTSSTPAFRVQPPSELQKIDFAPGDFLRTSAVTTVDNRWLLPEDDHISTDSGRHMLLSVSASSTSSVFEYEDEKPAPVFNRADDDESTTRDSGYDGSNEPVHFNEPEGSPTAFARPDDPQPPVPFERQRSMDGRNIFNVCSYVKKEANDDSENLPLQPSVIQGLLSAVVEKQNAGGFKRKSADSAFSGFAYPSLSASSATFSSRRRPLASIGNVLPHGGQRSPKSGKLMRRKSGLSLIQAGRPTESRKRTKQQQLRSTLSGSLSTSSSCEEKPSSLNDSENIDLTPKPSDKRRRRPSNGTPTNTVAGDNLSSQNVHLCPMVPPMHRCFSESAMLHQDDTVFQRLHSDESLIGDFTTAHSLPLVKRPEIPDAKCISSETLMKVLTNRQGFTDKEIVLIDCRYPYEYNGGHIEGALNIFEDSRLIQNFFEPLSSCASSDKLLVFYCEYSQKRGPAMLRYTRRIDRQRNSYPELHYPEIYLLEGGYLKFFSRFSNLCEPRAHVRMIDDSEQLRQFRIRSKSWACVGGTELKVVRPGLGNRRGLFRP